MPERRILYGSPELSPSFFTRRRRLLMAGLACGAAAALPTGLSAAVIPTPRQSEGPFYPLEVPLDSDNDLIVVEGRAQRAAGIITHVFGRVLNEHGKPVTGARVEIWQCDAFGRYHHPGDRGGNADPNFQGYGRMAVDGEGDGDHVIRLHTERRLTTVEN